MNLDDLRAVQSRERATDSLQDLRESFYADAAEYVEALREERDREAAEATDPFASPEVGRLTDEIEMAEQVVEAIYERRVGKIVKQASLAAAGMVAEDAGLTPEEKRLYDDLVARIAENKETVLDVLAGEEPPAGGSAATGGEATDGAATTTAGSPAAEASGSADPWPSQGARAAAGANGDAARPAAEAEQVAAPGGSPTGEGSAEPGGQGGVGDEAGGEGTGGGEAAGDAAAGDPAGSGGTGDEDPASTVERTTVRITRDVGEIVGVDERTYTLEAEDVVTLPRANAGPLLDREAAERLDAPDPS